MPSLDAGFISLYVGGVNLAMKMKWQHIWAFSVGRGLDAKGCKYSVQGDFA